MIESSRLRGVGFTSAVALVLLGGSVNEERVRGNAVAEVRAVLAGLAGDPICRDFNCELDCPSLEHELIEAPGDGNDKPVDEVGAHECFYVPNGCSVHSCSGNFAVLNWLELQLRRLDGQQVLALARDGQRLIVNPQRRVIQVLGCRDEVLLSVNLSPLQQRALAVED